MVCKGEGRKGEGKEVVCIGRGERVRGKRWFAKVRGETVKKEAVRGGEGKGRSCQ